MRWAIVGSSGMLGTELVTLLRTKGHEVIEWHRDNLNLELSVDQLSTFISAPDITPDVIVNCVAYTAVDKAESELFEASKVNGIYAGKLAQAAGQIGSRFFHVSTDYVFDGRSTIAYGVDHETNPQSTYGESKLVGEELVKDSGADFTIFRTAWLYGEYGRCFPKIIAGLLREHDSINVVRDQIGSPTWTRDLAEVMIDHGINRYGERIVHAVSSGQGSWFDFAVEIQQAIPEFESKAVNPISTTEYPTPAKRPAWSVLDNSETKGLRIGDWCERWSVAAPRVLSEFLKPYGFLVEKF